MVVRTSTFAKMPKISLTSYLDVLLPGSHVVGGGFLILVAEMASQESLLPFGGVT